MCLLGEEGEVFCDFCWHVPLLQDTVLRTDLEIIIFRCWPFKA